MSCQTPDSSLSVSVDHGVGGSVLFSHLDDLSVFGSHQDFTLDDRSKEENQPPYLQHKTLFCILQFNALRIYWDVNAHALSNKLQYLPSADRADVLHRLAGLQLKRSAALHLLIPKLHSPTLFSPVKYTNSMLLFSKFGLNLHLHSHSPIKTIKSGGSALTMASHLTRLSRWANLPPGDPRKISKCYSH